MEGGMSEPYAVVVTEHSEPLIEFWLREDQIALVEALLSRLIKNNTTTIGEYDYMCKHFCQRRAEEILAAIWRGEKKETP
jgi:hypothetical protein